MTTQTTLINLMAQLQHDQVEVLNIEANNFGVNALLNVNDEKEVKLDIEELDGQFKVIQTEGEAHIQFVIDELNEILEEIGVA